MINVTIFRSLINRFVLNVKEVSRFLKTIFYKVYIEKLNKPQICRILPYFLSAVIIVIEIVSLHFRQYGVVLLNKICQN